MTTARRAAEEVMMEMMQMMRKTIRQTMLQTTLMDSTERTIEVSQVAEIPCPSLTITVMATSIQGDTMMRVMDERMTTIRNVSVIQGHDL
jgi:hypothetical protein